MMRGSGWILPLFAFLIWLMCIAWPAIAVLLELPNQETSSIDVKPSLELLGTSVGWAAAVSLGAVILGWAPGRVLGRAVNTRQFVPLAILILVPICLPSYVVFYAWWQSWPPDSSLHEWLIANDMVRVGRTFTLYIGLVCWSWPLVAWCVAGSVASTPAEREELLILDGAGFVRRFSDRLRCDGGGLMLGALLAFLATMSNTTCFDLAEVFTFANELRAIEAVGASHSLIFISALPAVFIAASGALFVWMILPLRSPLTPTRTRESRPTSIAIASLVWLISVVIPLTLFGFGVLRINQATGIASEFFTLYGNSLVHTLLTAFLSGFVGAAIAIGISLSWADHRYWVRSAAHFIAVTFLMAAIIPGTLLATALSEAYNNKMFAELVYTSQTILIVGHLASFGFVAVLLGRWIARSEPPSIADLRRIDGAQTFLRNFESCKPRLLAGGIASASIIFILSVGEIPVTAQINPPARPGSGPLAVSLLNDMHYQRPQTVLIAAIIIMLGALGASLIAVCSLAIVRKSIKLGVIAMLPLILLSCSDRGEGIVRPLDTENMFGSPGRSLGQFGYPRAIDVDATRQIVYVIDKTARVQRFSLEGEPQFEWQMPEFEQGKPTGISIATDGTIFVADTHYYRVIVYSSVGDELYRFGEYGTGPGQFIYPTDIAFGKEGKLFVSEYGGNDRVQVFSSEGKYLYGFGNFGSELGEFNRPQSLAFDISNNELYIADACNHRIVVTDPLGNIKRMFGSAGREIGNLAYPYGLELLPDNTLLVCEFGNNRIQRFNADGKSLGVHGLVGRNVGELQYPWSVSADDKDVFVLDSGNNRVQVVSMKSIGVTR